MIVGVLLLLLPGCRGETPPAREAREAPGAVAAPAAPDSSTLPTIVFLGTSLTAGYGLDPDSAYPARFQRLVDSAGLRYDVVNAGVSGESSAGALGRIDWILQRPPAVLVIETGANDGLRGQDPDTVRANLQAIIDRTRTLAPKARIVIAGMEALPNLGRDYVTRFRRIFPEVARANGLTLIPFLLVDVAGVDSLNQGDGIHPNDRGAEIVAHTVWHTLAPLLRAAS